MQPVVDFHTHIGCVKSFAPDLKGWVCAGREDLLSYMDGAGIEWAVVLSLPHPEDPYSRIVSNEKLLRLAEGAGRRLIPFCSLDPRSPSAGRRLAELVERGCGGLGELKVGLRLSDPRLVRLLKAAENLGVPALLHVEEGPEFHFCHGVADLEHVARELGDLKLVLHGPGWWRHVTPHPSEEAYPGGKVEGEGLVQAYLRRHENLYADIAATSGLNVLRRDPEHAARFVEEFADKLIFGTDFPCMSERGQFGPNRAHLDFLLSLGLPQASLRKVLAENAAKLVR